MNEDYGILMLPVGTGYIKFDEEGNIQEIIGDIKFDGIYVSNQDIQTAKVFPNKKFYNLKEAILYSKNRIHNSYKSEILFYANIITTNSNIEKLLLVKKDGAIISIFNSLDKLILKANCLLETQDTDSEIINWFIKRSSSKEAELLRQLIEIPQSNNVSNITFKSNIKVEEKCQAISTLKQGFKRLEEVFNISNINVPSVSFEFYPTLKDKVRYQDNCIQVRIEEFDIETFSLGMQMHFEKYLDVIELNRMKKHYS